jgi:hypothetical protein
MSSDKRVDLIINFVPVILAAIKAAPEIIAKWRELKHKLDTNTLTDADLMALESLIDGKEAEILGA